MNIDVLNKLVENIIIPRFPWISDYSWEVHMDSGIDYYHLLLFAEDIGNINREDFRKVDFDARNLFLMLTPEPNERFYRAKITELKKTMEEQIKKTLSTLMPMSFPEIVDVHVKTHGYNEKFYEIMYFMDKNQWEKNGSRIKKLIEDTNSIFRMLNISNDDDWSVGIIFA